MNIRAVILLFAVFFFAAAPHRAGAEEENGEPLFSGAAGLAQKYDTNLDLTNEGATGNDLKDDFISEVSAEIDLKKSWESGWRLEGDLKGLADRPYEYREDQWYVANADCYLGFRFGDNTVSVLNQTRYYEEPHENEFNFFRNSATAAYKRIISPLWQARIGYENIVNTYPGNSFFNYYLNGGFAEARNTWTPAFTTYYSYDLQYYRGSYNSQLDDPRSSPEAGFRHTGEVGLDWFPTAGDALTAAYTFQVDDSSGQGLNQIGNFEGNQDSLDIDAEFNYRKHKATILFRHRFGDRWTLSAYEELIHKTFVERSDPLFGPREREDLLFMSSIWLKARLAGGLYAKARYIYRRDDSTLDTEDFQDHIVSLGMEYQF